MPAPKLECSVETMLLLPTPLLASITTSFEVTVAYFPRPTTIQLYADSIICDDGEELVPFTLTPATITFPPCTDSQISHSQTVDLSFVTNKASSFVTYVRAVEDSGMRYTNYF